jgi:predicted DNA-binding transcriptional regulator AlpA
VPDLAPDQHSATQSAPTPASNEGGTTHPEHTAMLAESKAVAAMLSLSTRKLWALTNCNAIPSRRIDRSVRYDLVEVRAWIAAGCPTEPGAADRVRKGVAR